MLVLRTGGTAATGPLQPSARGPLPLLPPRCTIQSGHVRRIPTYGERARARAAAAALATASAATPLAQPGSDAAAGAAGRRAGGSDEALALGHLRNRQRLLHPAHQAGWRLTSPEQGVGVGAPFGAAQRQLVDDATASGPETQSSPTAMHATNDEIIGLCERLTQRLRAGGAAGRRDGRTARQAAATHPPAAAGTRSRPVDGAPTAAGAPGIAEAVPGTLQEQGWPQPEFGGAVAYLGPGPAPPPHLAPSAEALAAALLAAARRGPVDPEAAGEAAELLWWGLGHRDYAFWVQLLAALRPAVRGLKPRQLASLLPPAAVLGVPVSRGWLVAAERQLRDHAASMGLFEASRLLPSLGLLGCTPSREACRALAGAAGAELQAWGWRAAVQQQGAANVLPPERALRALLQGVASVPGAYPGEAWLAHWAAAYRPHLHSGVGAGGASPAAAAQVLYLLACLQVLPPRDWEEAALARVQSGLGTGGPHRRARGSRSAAGAPDASEGNGSRSGQAALADGRGLPGPRASVDPQPLPLLLLCQAAWAAGALAAACPVSYGDGRERRVEALRRQLVAAAAAALAAQWPRGSLLRGEDAPPRGGVECGGIETPSWCQAVYAACAHDVAWAAVASGNENCLGLL